MSTQIPNKIDIAFANGEKIIGENGQTYYNYFNTDLRWLCGYNNEFIGNHILLLSNNLKKDPTFFKVLFKKVSSVLLENAGRLFSFVSFLNEPTVKIINDLFNTKEKFSISLSNIETNQENFKLKNFLDLISLEKETINSKRTKEGWEISKIKNFFKHYKNKISYFILSPLLLKEGLILSNETVNLIFHYCKKYKIPIIWDESLTCFYRTGTFYFLNQYNCKPDFISIDTNVYQDKKIHLLICSKNLSRKIKKSLNNIPSKNQVINIILLDSIIHFLSEFNIKDYIKTISYRLEHKLRALSSNLKNRFNFEIVGIITLIVLNNENISQKLNDDLELNHILFYFNKKNTFGFIPQIIMTTHSVDILIQLINNFFRKGIKIQKLE